MYNDTHWQAFLKLVGQPDLFQTDARFATHAERLKNIDALYGVVGQHMHTRTSAEWMKDLTTHDIPVMPMMKLDDLLTDPHLTATQGWLDVPHPFEGMLRQLRPPVRMSGTPTGVWRPAPRLGEHTEEVLCTLKL
jgi:crotonobetainyl-CoA:carnitine CoA-transferase CaiB-like acyl-CoA transferase